MYLLDFLIGGDGVNKIGLYIHIPFCKSKCPYCDFYSLRSSEADYDDYVEAVKKSLVNWYEKLGKTADTLYFGGGTPSLIGAERINEIVACAASLFGCNGEITVESNPSCVDGDFFKKISLSGVNRVSIGMQSAVDSERRQLGRLSDIKAVESAVNGAVSAGINNVSLDVMLGVPGQNEKSLGETLDFCVSSGAKHISAYILKLEEGTWFYENSHKLDLPDDDLTADLYLQMVETLAGNSFEQYEISNFSQKGYESKHNLKYWNCEEYLGIGPAAHSFIDGKRFYYPRDIDYFKNGNAPFDDGDGGDLQEYLMLRLRLKEGIVFEDSKKRFADFSHKEYIEKAAHMIDAGLMDSDGKSLFMTAKGFLVSNAIIEKIVY